MSGFQFPLQQLLELRSRAADDAQRQLADSQRETHRQRERLADLDAACADVAEAAALHPGDTVRPAILLNNGLHLAHLRAKTVTQKCRLEDCCSQENQRRQELLEAAREREVLERLKERRRDLFLLERARADNRAIDEAAVMAFHHNRHSA